MHIQEESHDGGSITRNSAAQILFAGLGWQMAVVGYVGLTMLAATAFAAAAVLPAVSRLPSDAWLRQIAPPSWAEPEGVLALLTMAVISAATAALLRTAAR